MLNLINVVTLCVCGEGGGVYVMSVEVGRNSGWLLVNIICTGDMFCVT
jgi:hypothetical protein